MYKLDEMYIVVWRKIVRDIKFIVQTFELLILLEKLLLKIN